MHQFAAIKNLLVDDREEPEDVHNLYESEIANFYCGANVFVTGGTGFMGCVLVEKLLRSCPNLGKMYLLIRAKKGKQPKDRLAHLFEGSLYEKLKRENPSALSKVFLVMGDCTEPNLGLNSSDQELLIREVNVVFHVAATVRFDETLRTAVAINVNATKELLKISHHMKKLKALVHMSTAYAHCPSKEIDEKFYPVGLSEPEIDHLVKTVDDRTLRFLTPLLLDRWPNTYTFTKAIAEDVLREQGKILPIAIVRPSIVVSTCMEPTFGWINNVFGLTGVLFGAGIGLLRSIHCDENIAADVVPVDMALNATIVSAWDIANTWQKNSLRTKSDTNVETEGGDIPIYNYVSSAQHPITWGEIRNYCEFASNCPSAQCIWYYFFTLNKYSIVHTMYVYFLHLLPAAITDLILLLMGKERMMWKTYMKLSKFINVIAYFTVQEWKFNSSNVQHLWSKLNPRDQQLFNFNIENLDWEIFMSYTLRGTRAYLINESYDNLEYAKKRYKRLKVLHYVVLTVLALSLLRLIWWSGTTLLSYYLVY